MSKECKHEHTHKETQNIPDDSGDTETVLVCSDCGAWYDASYGLWES